MKIHPSLTKVMVVRLLCAAALVALPHNLFLKHILPTSYQHGLLLDYFIPKLFISDFFLIPLTLWAFTDFLKQLFARNVLTKNAQNSTILLSLSTFWTASHGGAEVMWWWIGLLASFMVGHWLSQPWAKPIFKHWLLPTTLTLTLIIQAFFANVQWHTQHSLTPYHFFGETNLASPHSLLTTTINNAQKVLPYGTTPHPNILAGTTILTWFLVFLFYTKSSNKKFAYALLTTASLATLSILALTDSLSANLSLVAVGFLALFLTSPFHTKFLSLNQNHYKRVFLTVLVCTAIFLATASGSRIASTSVARRLNLQKAAISAPTQPLQWIFGTGWGGTLKHIAANPSRTNEIARFAQPTHHTPSLWALETGILGALALLLFVWAINLKQFYLLVALTPTLILDHYWLTSHHAWWLLFLLISFLSHSED